MAVLEKVLRSENYLLIAFCSHFQATGYEMPSGECFDSETNTDAF